MKYFNNGNILFDESLILPKLIKDKANTENSDTLLSEKTALVSFREDNLCLFLKKGAYIVLDFGLEIAGGVRIITRKLDKTAKFNLRFGESYSEAITPLYEKNTTNDHSPRDFDITVSMMSDLTFGQTGFRFLRIELLDDTEVGIQSIFAVSKVQHFDFEGKIITDDNELNRIIKTAIYTLKLTFQNGYIWDGIKRDRLVFSGDLHPEILTSMYIFGDNPNIPNSLEFLKNDTKPDGWVNNITTYSAWWIIDLIDYYLLSQNKDFLTSNIEYARYLLKKIDSVIDENGSMNFESQDVLKFYLDWPTCETDDAVIGTAMVFIIAAEKFNRIQPNEYSASIIKKLNKYIFEVPQFKQTMAFQNLASETKDIGNLDFLEKNGANGFSTFMAYYILKALSNCGCNNTLEYVKEYYGGMLSVGATTFWEDFDLLWLNNCNNLNELPMQNQKDIHGDFGKFCYKNFRHSLCHGWSSAVVAYIIENILGFEANGDFTRVSLHPRLEHINDINAEIASPYGKISVVIKDKKVVSLSCPKEIHIST